MNRESKPRGFQQPITIKEAIEKIEKIGEGKLLLPAIQRKFIWSHEQIEMLFDSIMQGYPINSMMFWKITDENIKRDYKFYKFLEKYKQRFAEDNVEYEVNEDNSPSNIPDFEAVIDGQQRLSSLYIGLKGTYAYKLPRKWWEDSEKCLPTRRLYINLEKECDQEYDTQKKYNFKFRIDAEASNESKESKESIKNGWFRVGRILGFKSEEDVDDYLQKEYVSDYDYARETLRKLYSVIHEDKILNYYLEDRQDLDTVLEIFIRTNSGGTKLSFSDLLMSISSANWHDARKEIEAVIDEVFKIAPPNDKLDRENKETEAPGPQFRIDKDFILKTCLFLFLEDIRFKLKNFTMEAVKYFDCNWSHVRASIVTAFKLFASLGFNNTTFRAKYAAIPIIYYIYKHKFDIGLDDPNYEDSHNKEMIRRWLLLTFVKKIFSGSTDSVLRIMRETLGWQLETKYQGITEARFPYKKMIEAFQHRVPDYSFDDAFIDELIDSEKGGNEATYVLRLLYSDLDFNGEEIHEDHLHPKSLFWETNIDALPEGVREFAKDPKNWNSVANLQLLSGSLNTSKKDMPLEKWVHKDPERHKVKFLSEGKSLDIKDFEEFITNRRENLRKEIKDIFRSITTEED